MTHRLQIHPLHWQGMNLLWLYLGEDRERQLGQILGSAGPVASADQDLQELERATGRSFGATCGVVNVFVTHDLINLGYGIDLYEALARYAARRFDAPIVSSSLFGSTPSDEAKRVWASERLAQRITVRGHCAWGGELDD